MTVWDSMALNAPHTEREIRSIHETGAGDLPTKLDGFPLLEEAIKEHFGQRCDEYMAGCPCCDTWAELDRLRAIRAAEARELSQDGDESNIKKPDIAMRCAECDCANGGDECNWFGSPVAIITALRAEIDRCHERLEIKRMHRMDLATGETTPVDVPLQERPSLPDGIDCRDETIRLLRDNIETLRNNNAQLLAQLRELAQDGETAPGSTTEPENATCPSAGGYGGLAGQPINTAKYADMMKCASRAVTLDDAWAQRLSNLKPMATDETIAHALRNDAGWMAWQEVQRLRAENANLLIMLTEAHSRVVAELEEERDTQASLVRCACAYDRPDDLCLGHKRIFDAIAARRMQAILTAIAAEKATWPHAGVMHAAARTACDAIAERVKKLMGVA